MNEKIPFTSAEYGQKLHEVTEEICKERIGMFIQGCHCKKIIAFPINLPKV